MSPRSYEKSEVAMTLPNLLLGLATRSRTRQGAVRLQLFDYFMVFVHLRSWWMMNKFSSQLRSLRRFGGTLLA